MSNNGKRKLTDEERNMLSTEILRERVSQKTLAQIYRVSQSYVSQLKTKLLAKANEKKYIEVKIKFEEADYNKLMASVNQSELGLEEFIIESAIQKYSRLYQTRTATNYNQKSTPIERLRPPAPPPIAPKRKGWLLFPLPLQNGVQERIRNNNRNKMMREMKSTLQKGVKLKRVDPAELEAIKQARINRVKQKKIELEII